MDQNIKARRQEKRRREDAILNRVLLIFGCAVAVEIVLLLFSRGFPAVSWLGGLSVLVPAAAVLAMIYYLYQRDFFCIALICAGGIFSLWLYRRQFLLHPTRIRCGFVLAFLLLAAAAVLFALLRRKKGALPAQVRRFFPRETCYPLLYVTCGLTALLLALTLALGGTAAYYLLFALVAWLFIMAVVYTVKLM